MVSVLSDSFQGVVSATGQTSAILYLTVTLLQIAQYGVKAWWKLGMGMGNRFDQLDNDLVRQHRIARRKRKRV